MSQLIIQRAIKKIATIRTDMLALANDPPSKAPAFSAQMRGLEARLVAVSLLLEREVERPPADDTQYMGPEVLKETT